MWHLLENVHFPVLKKGQLAAVEMTIVGISVHWKILQMIVSLACTKVNGYLIVNMATTKLSKILMVHCQVDSMYIHDFAWVYIASFKQLIYFSVIIFQFWIAVVSLS